MILVKNLKFLRNLIFFEIALNVMFPMSHLKGKLFILYKWHFEMVEKFEFFKGLSHDIGKKFHISSKFVFL